MEELEYPKSFNRYEIDKTTYLESRIMQNRVPLDSAVDLDYAVKSYEEIKEYLDNFSFETIVSSDYILLRKNIMFDLLFKTYVEMYVMQHRIIKAYYTKAMEIAMKGFSKCVDDVLSKLGKPNLIVRRYDVKEVMIDLNDMNIAIFVIYLNRSLDDLEFLYRSQLSLIIRGKHLC